MASLKLRRPDHSSESHELSRTQPLTIGRQPFNDICIPEPEVGSMHCRISWNKTNFEVTAATSDGVEVNSAVVAHWDLKPGDSIRIGNCELLYEDDSVKLAPPAVPHSSRKRERQAEAAAKPAEDMSLFEGPILTESQAMIDSLFGPEDDYLETPRSPAKPRSKGGKTPFVRPAVRPGEQDVLKSPLVLGLAGGGLTLLLITGIFWFLLSREKSNRLYDQAVAELNDGQYSQSISTFEKFIETYPQHALKRQAERGLGKAQIQKELSGAAPLWKRGLERLHEFIKTHRNESDFSVLHTNLFQYAEQISLGAAKSAEVSRDPELLTVSKDAQDLLERYSDPAAAPTGSVSRIVDQRNRAIAAIEKQKAFDQAMTTVDQAIADRKPMVALSERERLVRSFPDFANLKRIRDSLQKSLDLERSIVSTDETERDAITTDEPVWSSEPLLGILHARSRMDDVSAGRIILAVAKDCCYALDPATGELIWRRIIGFRTPFFPITVSGSQSVVLLFDTRSNALLACQLTTGRLIWKQQLDARAIGKPLVHDGQIYLTLSGNSLVRIDLETGKRSATVRFSQNLATAAVLSRDENYLLVPGEMAMIYALALRTTAQHPALAAVATTFTDHSAGSITAPPLMLGDLLLLCENDRAESARLRLWNASQPNQSLVELKSSRLSGQVRDAPVIRGNQLVVPSSGEQFAAFIVSDDAGHEELAPVGEYRADSMTKVDQVASPLFVAIGPDNQFWSAGSAFRRFEITGNTIRMDSNSTAPGIASQPLQAMGDQFFVGRKSRYSDAVTISAIDRDRMTNPWRTIVGDAPLEMMPIRDGGLVWVGESGTIYRVGKNRITQGGIDLKAGTDLELPLNVTHPIRANVLPDQRIVISAAGDTSVLLVVGASGQLNESHKLDEVPEAAPLQLDDGLIIPLPSRLKVLSNSRKPVQDLIRVVGDEPHHRWSHLVRIDGKELIAMDESGRLSRIQFRSGDLPHLAEVAEFKLDSPITRPPLLKGESLILADSAGTVRQMNIRSFDIDAQTKLEGTILNLWSADPNLLVHAGDGKLRCLAEGKTFPELWSYDLAKLEPVGPVIQKGEELWLACRNGTILVLNFQSGTEIRRIDVPQSLSIGLRQVQDLLFAVASDGSLYRLE